MDVTWKPEPLSDEAKLSGMKPFDYRGALGRLTLRAYQYFASATWIAAVYDQSLGLAVGGTFLHPLADAAELPDLATAEAKAEFLAREVLARPGITWSGTTFLTLRADDRCHD